MEIVLFHHFSNMTALTAVNVQLNINVELTQIFLQTYAVIPSYSNSRLTVL